MAASSVLKAVGFLRVPRGVAAVVRAARVAPLSATTRLPWTSRLSASSSLPWPVRGVAPSSRRAFLVSARAFSAEGAGRVPPKHPLVLSRLVGLWLVGTSSLVFGIVVLGGLTRLTESGLSITEWKPVTGAIPPRTQAEWEEEFAKYQQSPEFKQLNLHLTLDEFKFIFFMEWAHRLWGRAIGAVFILPACYFWFRGRMAPRHGRQVLAMLVLLGLQGFIGWWMVQLGLDQAQLDERRLAPTVLQYRLTLHLGTAFALYCGMLWTGGEILREAKWRAQAAAGQVEAVRTTFSQLLSTKVVPLRRLGTVLLAVVFVTALTGGMVAGLDAGLMYNSFPHMIDTPPYFPPAHEMFLAAYARTQSQFELVWRNVLENPVTVQLHHRIWATSTFFAVFASHMLVNKRYRRIIPKGAFYAMNGAMGLVTLQAALGISTLIYLVPIPLAAAHQAGALALLTGMVVFAGRMRVPSAAIQAVVRAAK